MSEVWRSLRSVPGLQLGTILLMWDLAARPVSREALAAVIVTSVMFIGANLAWVNMLTVIREDRGLTAQANGRQLSRWMVANLATGRLGIAYVLFQVVVAGPLAEEGIYRGLLFFALDGAPWGVVVFVTSALFSRAHARGREVAVSHFFAGLLFGLFRVKYGIWAAFLAHALLNLHATVCFIWIVVPQLREAREMRGKAPPQP